jgi:phage tail sheath protein FI
LTGGANGDAATEVELKLAWDLFINKEKVEVSLLFTGKVPVGVQRYVVQMIAENRMDCVGFISAVNVSDSSPIIGDTSESLDKIIEWYNAVNLNSSYGVADSGYKYQYDKYNDVYRWVPLNADVAGLCARTDLVADTWYSPAGLNRGQIKNVTRLAYNPNKAARDELFSRNINPVVSFPGEGTVLFGDKTTLRRPSAFDAINVRRLFIILEKAISIASRYYLFEQNTELTRQLFVGSITPILRDVRGRQGITDFYVDVGPNVNTSDTIDAGELRCNIFIKPVRSIRFISLSFIATRTSATFSEIEI